MADNDKVLDLGHTNVFSNMYFPGHVLLANEPENGNHTAFNNNFPLKVELATDNDLVARGSGMQNSELNIPGHGSVYFHAKFGPVRLNENIESNVEESVPVICGPANIQDNPADPEQMNLVDLESETDHEDNFGDFIIDLEEFERNKALEKFHILEEMFPDAETIFLKAKCAEYALYNEAFDFFLEEMMIPGDYPRKQVHTENEQPDEQNNNNIDNSINKFDLHAFLKKYPDPVKHFSTNFKAVHYIQHCLNYLQLRYKFVGVYVIRSAFNKSNFNMYLTDLALRNKPKSRKLPRRPNELRRAFGKPTEDFYDTVTFIENEEEILQYLSDRAIARENAVEEARRANALLICGCCFADDLLAEEVSHCMEGHIFCKECILRSCEVNIGDGKLDFPCLQECTSFFEVLILKDILPEATYNKLERKLQGREVASANIPGLVSCPFCEFSAIPPEEARVFDCDNCKKQSCRLCRRVSHIPYRCSEVENENIKSRTYVEERMTEALLRTCYRCNAKFIREDGCNKMVCVCGAMMCYICRQPIKDYSHFQENRNSNHVQLSNRCPLWTNNKNVHQHEVNRERMNAIEFQKRKNPNLDESIFKKHKN